MSKITNIFKHIFGLLGMILLMGCTSGQAPSSTPEPPHPYTISYLFQAQLLTSPDISVTDWQHIPPAAAQKHASVSQSLRDEEPFGEPPYEGRINWHENGFDLLYEAFYCSTAPTLIIRNGQIDIYPNDLIWEDCITLGTTQIYQVELDTKNLTDSWVYHIHKGDEKPPSLLEIDEMGLKQVKGRADAVLLVPADYLKKGRPDKTRFDKALFDDQIKEVNIILAQSWDEAVQKLEQYRVQTLVIHQDAIDIIDPTALARFVDRCYTLAAIGLTAEQFKGLTTPPLKLPDDLASNDGNLSIIHTQGKNPRFAHTLSATEMELENVNFWPNVLKHTANYDVDNPCEPPK